MTGSIRSRTAIAAMSGILAIAASACGSAGSAGDSSGTPSPTVSSSSAPATSSAPSSTLDAQFLQMLSENGIQETGDKPIAAAQAVCDGYAAGKKGDAILQDLSNSYGYPPDQATIIMTGATEVYCPDAKPGT